MGRRKARDRDGKTRRPQTREEKIARIAKFQFTSEYQPDPAKKRPKSLELRQMCQELSADAINNIWKIANNTSVKPVTRLQANIFIVEYAGGKAAQAIAFAMDAMRAGRDDEDPNAIPDGRPRALTVREKLEWASKVAVALKEVGGLPAPLGESDVEEAVVVNSNGNGNGNGHGTGNGPVS